MGTKVFVDIAVGNCQKAGGVAHHFGTFPDDEIDNATDWRDSVACTLLHFDSLQPFTHGACSNSRNIGTNRAV